MKKIVSAPRNNRSSFHLLIWAVAGTILGLVSKAGAYYNGVVLVTDGGRLGQLPSTY